MKKMLFSVILLLFAANVQAAQVWAYWSCTTPAYISFMLGVSDHGIVWTVRQPKVQQIMLDDDMRRTLEQMQAQGKDTIHIRIKDHSKHESCRNMDDTQL